MNLAGKKKQIIDAGSFYQINRIGDVINFYNSDEKATQVDESQFDDRDGVKYFYAPNNDKLRVILGKSWDYSQKDQNNTELEYSVFRNLWPSPTLFYGCAVQMEECSPPETVEAAGLFGSTKSVIKQKIVLKSAVNFALNDVPEGTDDEDILQSWINFMKRGVITTGLEYAPIISGETAENKNFYFDHHHLAVNPFTPEELENKSPTGKAFFAKYSTYYNERTRGIEAEKNQARNIINANSKLNNSLPSIYSFLRLAQSEQTIQQQSINLDNVAKFMAAHPEETMYKVLLNALPFHSHLLLHGKLGQDSKVIEQIILLNFNNFDADKLFSDYYKEYANLVSNDPDLQFLPVDVFTPGDQAGTNDTPEHKIRSLENIMTNIVFSPDSLKFLNKVDQYKKHFPSYCELEFTANLFTQIGDMMKKFHLTKIMSDVVLSSLTPPEANFWDDSFVGRQSVSTGWTGVATYPIQNNYNFVDYFEEKTFDSLANISAAVPSGGIISTVKKAIDFPLVLEIFNLPNVIDQDGVFYGEQKPISEFSKSDLRNYTSYFKSDLEPEVDFNQGGTNIIFKKLFFNSFLAKIVDTYNNNKRSYEQIMNGVPAYTEDLFYRIEKIKIVNEQEEVIQNILIPNTSELDIVKYVDTQVKYSNSVSENIKYKYNVYVHRLVFGSKYNYSWKMDQDNKYFGGYTKRDLTVESPYDYSAELGYGITSNLQEQNSSNDSNSGKPSWFEPSLGNVFDKIDLFAAVDVEIHPSIQLIEDLLFTTPDIIILDRPPVPPDVEVVPYRAINNRIKILLSGAVDRYRAKPIEILETDAAEFQKIKDSQLSTDGRIEFGSDDPVSNFQIFRTGVRPSSYSDFTLYDQISQGFFEESNIFPNTKYYYTFRTIDNSGHISNPSPVYEVELIDEKGAVRPIIRTIDMEPKKSTSPVKECQKYLYLKPKLKQLYLFDQLGENSIFSDPNNKKRFKMRLTSKGSGKKIDINFSFKRK